MNIIMVQSMKRVKRTQIVNITLLEPAMFDLDMPVQDNVDSSIGPASVTVEDLSISREGQ